MDKSNLNFPPDKSLTALKVEGLTSVTNLSFVMHRPAYRTAPLSGFTIAYIAQRAQSAQSSCRS